MSGWGETYGARADFLRRKSRMSQAFYGETEKWSREVRLSFFFFSSRRRHTRLQGDWSSDVCSSDLGPRARRIFRRDSSRDEHGRSEQADFPRNACGNRSRCRSLLKPPEGENLSKDQGPRLHEKKIDRKSTRLNSSHLVISYAVFCLKKKNL